MEVRQSGWFVKYLDRLPDDDYNKVDDFIEHVQKQGLVGLPGSLLKSDRIDDEALSKYAQDEHLWHYHVGIPRWVMTKGIGRYKSKFYLHFQRFSTHIRIVGMNDHHPFTLPTSKMMENEKNKN